MDLTTLNRKLMFTLSLAFAAALAGETAAPTPERTSPDQFERDLRELCDLQPQTRRQSADEQDRLRAIMARLANGEPREVVAAMVEGLRRQKRNREIPAYREVLPQLPSLKQEMLREIRLQSDATVKAGLIACISRVKGAEVIRALLPPLDDHRLAGQGGLSELRVCDYAFNAVYLRVAQIRELGLDYTSAMSDAIHESIPLERRDERIAKLKSALTARFGADLNLPDDI